LIRSFTPFLFNFSRFPLPVTAQNAFLVLDFDLLLHGQSCGAAVFALHQRFCYPARFSSPICRPKQRAPATFLYPASSPGNSCASHTPRLFSFGFRLDGILTPFTTCVVSISPFFLVHSASPKRASPPSLVRSKTPPSISLCYRFSVEILYRRKQARFLFVFFPIRNFSSPLNSRFF